MYRLITILFFSVVCALPVLADSANEQAGDSTITYDFSKPNDDAYPVRGEAIISHASHKFTRGLTNVFTGLGEIPRQMIISYNNDGPALFIPIGFCSGLFMSIVRTTYGAFEVVTFLMPIDGTYSSLLSPDFVWDPFEYKVVISDEKE